MSNSEIPEIPGSPDFGELEPEIQQYLKELGDTLEKLPQQLEHRRAIYMARLHTRKDAIRHVIESFEQNHHESYKRLRINNLRDHESYTRVAFHQYVDALLMLPESELNARARALELALSTLDKSQAIINESETGFMQYFSPSILKEIVEDIVTTTDSIEATDRACAIYDKLVKPTEQLLNRFDL